ncbi:MAG: hypothetical protein GY853_14600 [PVC group bacterium]|nr:hypothetical protein [PVC group bacterium]
MPGIPLTTKINIQTKAAKKALKDLESDAKKAAQDIAGAMEEGSKPDLSKVKQSYNKLFDAVEQDAKKAGKESGKEFSAGFSDALKGLGAAAIAVGIGGLVSGLKDIVKETAKVQGAISKFTGAAGNDLKKLTASAQATADTFDQDINETLQATNSLAKNYGISFEEAQKVINDGFLMGADLSGEFLAVLKEFPEDFKAAGFSAQEFAKYNALVSKSGIYGDRGQDAISEFSVKITEMTTAASDALKGMGIDSEDLQKRLESGALSQRDAIQLISQEMLKVGLDTQDSATVLADIFGSPAEDAQKLIPLLANLDEEMRGIAKGTDDYTKNQEASLAANQQINTAMAELTQKLLPAMTEMTKFGAAALTFLGDNLKEVGTIGATVAGVWIASQAKVIIATTKAKIAIIQETFMMGKQKAMVLLAAAQMKIYAAAQWLANAAMSAFPIILVVAGIAALIAGIVLAYQKLDWFRDLIDGIWQLMKDWANFIIGVYVGVFTTIYDVVRPLIDDYFPALGKAIDVIIGAFKDAAGAVAGAVEWFGELFSSEEEAADGAEKVAKGTKDVAEETEKMSKELKEVPDNADKAGKGLKKFAGAAKTAKMSLSDYTNELVKLSLAGKEGSAKYTKMFAGAVKAGIDEANATAAQNKIKFQIEFETGLQDIAAQMEDIDLEAAGLDSITEELDKATAKTYSFLDVLAMANDVTKQYRKEETESISEEEQLRLDKQREFEAQKVELMENSAKAMSQAVGGALVNVLADQESAGKAVVKTMFAVLESMIPIILAQITGIELGSKGVGGLVTIPILTGVLVAALNVAKSAVGMAEGGTQKGRNRLVMLNDAPGPNYEEMVIKGSVYAKHPELLQGLNAGKSLESLGLYSQPLAIPMFAQPQQAQVNLSNNVSGVMTLRGSDAVMIHDRQMERNLI